MAKQPEIETIEDGYYNKYRLNKNFRSIVEKFDEMLSRRTTGPETPNFMNVDLDVANANITNVKDASMTLLTIVSENFTGFSDYYVWKLAQLVPTQGDIITHDENGDPILLELGSNGEILRSSGTLPTWGADTDTDTVGVTIQEDGVTVAENVTTIDILWNNITYPTIVTTPAGNQVDIALDDVYTSTISAIWEDGPNELDSNVTPSGPSAVIFNIPGEVTRIDLINDVGLSAVPSSDNEYYVILETSNLVEDSSGPPPAVGTWENGVRFYDNTGTTTPLTGVRLLAPAGEIDANEGTTDGGNLLTTYCGIPAGTRYVDFDHADAFLFPIFATYARVNPRYRAIVSAGAKNANFQSPEGISYPGGVNPTVTVK